MNKKNQIALLDDDFDSFDFGYLGAPAPGAQRPEFFPHCDCIQANLKFGRKLDKNGNMTEPTMVPVEVRAHGLCVDCGYQTCLQPKASKSTNTFKPSAGGVVGVCVATGTKLRFASENQARLAGYYGVKASMATGAVRSGHIWHRG